MIVFFLFHNSLFYWLTIESWCRIFSCFVYDFLHLIFSPRSYPWQYPRCDPADGYILQFEVAVHGILCDFSMDWVSQSLVRSSILFSVIVFLQVVSCPILSSSWCPGLSLIVSKFCMNWFNSHCCWTKSTCFSLWIEIFSPLLQIRHCWCMVIPETETKVCWQSESNLNKKLVVFNPSLTMKYSWGCAHVLRK